MIDLLKISLKEIPIETLIDLLKKHLNPISANFNTIILMSQRLNTVKTEFSKGFIKNEDKLIEYTKVTTAIHGLVDELEENDFLEKGKSHKVNESDIDEIVEFIQSKIDGSECEAIYEEEIDDTWGLFDYLQRTHHKYRENKFEYSKGIGKLSLYLLTIGFNYERNEGKENRDFEQDQEYYEYKMIEFPLKDLKSVEMILSKDHLSEENGSDIFELKFMTRNQRKTIRTTTSESVFSQTAFMLTRTHQNPKFETTNECSYKCDNREDGERLVKAFRALMEINGAKSELF